MAIDARIQGLNSSGDEISLKASDGGILHNLPYQVVWTAMGYSWEAMNTSAIASLIVRPSTLSQITLYNNSGSKNFVIERAFAHNLISIATCSFGIWLCVHPTGMTAPTGNDITIRNSLSGLAAGAEGLVDIAESVANNGWFPWGNSRQQAVASVPGAQAEAQIGGRIIIPPTAGISMQIVANTAIVTCTVGLHWFAIPNKELSVN